MLAYSLRRAATGTVLESHVRWQITTCWSALGWLLLAVALAATVFLLIFGMLTMVATLCWVGYRVVRGWRALRRRAPVSSARSVFA
jgi:uncharacterized membrane protein